MPFVGLCWEIGAVLAGAGVVCWVCAPGVSSTVEDAPWRRVAMMASVIDVIMKITAAVVVAFDRTVAEPRGPNAV